MIIIFTPFLPLLYIRSNKHIRIIIINPVSQTSNFFNGLESSKIIVGVK